MHGNICHTHQVHDAGELKQHLTKVWHGLGQSVIDDTMYEWHKHLWACKQCSDVVLEARPMCLEANFLWP